MRKKVYFEARDRSGLRIIRRHIDINILTKDCDWLGSNIYVTREAQARPYNLIELKVLYKGIICIDSCATTE